MPWRAVPLIGMLSLSACAMGASEGGAGACLPVVDYRRAEQAQAAVEVEALPEAAVLVRMLADYAVIRKQAVTVRLHGARMQPMVRTSTCCQLGAVNRERNAPIHTCRIWGTASPD
ncbi:hypothetical protein [Roseovarius autotrophicus]|uniref:hypothetical protein n=1 Tax=Roseovarius autotrophicus TaxID=2824121 RepID=UPI001FFC33EC|nr:hypothetical protein [Roseovarius autotrophicus]